jgi:class 3 adenylate cyclase
LDAVQIVLDDGVAAAEQADDDHLPGAALAILRGPEKIDLLFTDVVGSTAFYAERGDPAAFVEIKRHFDEVFAIVAASNGAVVKTIGDAVMATFGTPVDAVRAAPKPRPTASMMAKSRNEPLTA